MNTTMHTLIESGTSHYWHDQKNNQDAHPVETGVQSATHNPAISEDEDAGICGDLSVGRYAYTLLNQYYRQITKQEKAVLTGREPEALHAMRVAVRRLSVTQRVFASVVERPKPTVIKSVMTVARSLGGLRDLDVQMSILQTRYRPHLAEAEQQIVSRVLAELANRRQGAFEKVTDSLTRSRSPYRTLKSAYKKWLSHPHSTPYTDRPLVDVLPNLVTPWLAKLFLHPGWLVATADIAPQHNVVLHDLRKACRNLRYEVEFFQPFYGARVQLWLRELRSVQGILGTVQDGDLLLGLLHDTLPKHTHYPNLQSLIISEREEAMADWDALRQKYLSPGFQRELYCALLAPVLR
jgi:CHAD domain-containing protein